MYLVTTKLKLSARLRNYSTRELEYKVAFSRVTFLFFVGRLNRPTDKPSKKNMTFDRNLV
jgi:hypothetical protein